MPDTLCIAQLGTFRTPITALATTQDGALLVVAPQEGNLELWDVSSGERMCSIAVPVGLNQGILDEVYSVAMSDDGVFLAASLLKTGAIYAWTFEGDLLGRIEGDGSFTRTVCFLPNTSLLLIVLRDTRIQLWDVQTQQLHSTLPGANEKYPGYLSGIGRMYKVACSSNGSHIALDSGTTRSMVSVWEVQQKGGQVSCKDQNVFRWSAEDFFSEVKFRPLHAQLYHLVKKTMEGYDTRSLKLAKQIKHGGIVPVTFCFSPQGDLLAFADYDGLVYIWNMEKGEVVLHFDAREQVQPSYLYYDMSVQKMVWLAQSGLLATAGLKRTDGSGINTVKLWQFTR